MTQITWNWDPPADPTPPDSYNLYTGQFPGSETLRQGGITETSFTDTAIVIGRPTSAYVTAVKAGQEGPASQRLVITVPPPPAACGMCPPMLS